jgi:endonuclease YncB( thermonuclease family)
MATSSLAAAALIAGVASVIDGDSIEVHGVHIRLKGVDAPESRQLCTRPTGERWRCGQQASLALSDQIGGSTVSCDPRDTDRYGRTVPVCSPRGLDLNGWLVTRGWAVAYRRYSRDYVRAEG